MSEENYVTTSYEFPTRVSFFYGITPKVKTDDNGVQKNVYSSQLLFPKKDEATNAAINSVIDRLSAEKWPNGTPKAAKITYRDGDIEGKRGVPDTREPGEEPYGGNYWMNTKEQNKPITIIGPYGKPLDRQDVPEDLIVSGDYVVAKIKCFTWGPGKFGTGVSWELISVQLIKKGVPLTGDDVNKSSGFKPIAVGESADLMGDDQDPDSLV